MACGMTWRATRTGTATQWVGIFCDHCGKRLSTLDADEYARICEQSPYTDFCSSGCEEAYCVIHACLEITK